MLADPAFREKVCVAMHAVRRDVTIDGAPESMKVVVDQTQPAEGIPSFAKKFVGDEIQIVQREQWKGGTGATLKVEIPGKPGALDGTIGLSENGGGTIETVARRHQGEDPDDRRQARGPDRRPARHGAAGPRSGSARPGWPATASLSGAGAVLTT